jgi:hypothetical protein
MWYILHELVEALITLRDGPESCIAPREEINVLPESTNYLLNLSKDWVPILHLDMKTGNVSLEALGENAECPAYPKPVLCEFGLSQLATDDFLYSDSSAILDAKFSGTGGSRSLVSVTETKKIIYANT